MHFVFNRQNHRADLRMSFDDITDTLGAQLEHFGHSWEINDTAVGISPEVVNVVFEGFTEEAIDVYGVQADQGAQFICLATEQPTGYDAAGLGGEFNFGMPDHMLGRQANFIKACARLNFRAVWALVNGADTLAWYRLHCPRVAYLPIGCAPDRPAPASGAPEFDFGMYGSILRGGRRWQMLERLHQATGASVHILGANGIVPIEERDQEMLRCRVLLQIRPNDASELVSSSRIAASVRMRAVVSEYHKRHEPYSRIVRFATADNFASFVGACRQTLQNWRREHAAQLDRFRTVLSPENTLLPCLEVAAIGRAGEERSVGRPALAADGPNGTLVAVALWGGAIEAWLRDGLPRLAAADQIPALARQLAGQGRTLALRVYTTDEGVNRLLETPAVHELGKICDVDLRGLAPTEAEGIFVGPAAEVVERLQRLATIEAGRAGQLLTFLPVEMVAA